LGSVDDLGERLKKRLASGWTENKVRALTNEAILERLAGFGIVTSVDEFVELAHPEHAADAVAAGWRRSFDVSARGFDNDFIGIAACVLWERLLPEWPSVEMLDERMQAGYAALKANDVTRACDIVRLQRGVDGLHALVEHLEAGPLRQQPLPQDA